MSEKSFYLSTPIYYVNDAPHIGHAYTTVAGDVLTRWHRQRGEAVFFLTGTDEHGQKVLNTAEKNGVAPQDWCDRLVEDSGSQYGKRLTSPMMISFAPPSHATWSAFNVSSLV